MILQGAVTGWVRYVSNREARLTDRAVLVTAAGAALGVGLVARDCGGAIHPQAGTSADDVGLGQRDQRRVDSERATLDTGLRSAHGELLEGGNEFGAAVRVAAVV